MISLLAECESISCTLFCVNFIVFCTRFSLNPLLRSAARRPAPLSYCSPTLEWDSLAWLLWVHVECISCLGLSVREWTKKHDSLLNGCCSSASYLKKYFLMLARNISFFFLTCWQCRNICIVGEILHCAWNWFDLCLWSEGKGNIYIFLFLCVCYLNRFI